MAVLVSVAYAHACPSVASVRQGQASDDFMIPPPSTPEGAEKAKAFVDAYHAYIDSLGKIDRSVKKKN